MNWPIGGPCAGGSSTPGHNGALIDATYFQGFRTDGLFWLASDANAANLKDCEIWARGIHLGDGYLAADSRTGSHTVLFGTSGGVPYFQTYVDGAPLVCQGNYSFAPGESFMLGAGYDYSSFSYGGVKTLNVYANGILDGQIVVPDPGIRTCPAGNGQFCIGGPFDHSTWTGWLAWLMFLEGGRKLQDNAWLSRACQGLGISPMGFGSAKDPNTGGNPQIIMNASGLWDFGSVPEGGTRVHDTSRAGYQGRFNSATAGNFETTELTAQWKPGLQDFVGVSSSNGQSTPYTRNPVPYVTKRTDYAAQGSLIVPVRPVPPPTPPPAFPGTLLAWDSFARANQTEAFAPALDNLDLGHPEAGTLAGQAYRCERAGWYDVPMSKRNVVGLLGGYVYNNDEFGAQLFTLDTGLRDYTVRARRQVSSTWLGNAAVFGLAFRMVDNNNYYYVLVDPRPAPIGGANLYTYGYFSGGVQTPIANFAMPSSSASELAVVVSGFQIDFVWDGVLNQTVNISAGPDGTRAGGHFWSWNASPAVPDQFITSGCRLTALGIHT